MAKNKLGLLTQKDLGIIHTALLVFAEDKRNMISWRLRAKTLWNRLDRELMKSPPKRGEEG